jgi:streptomycin 6-kinase
LRQNGINPNNVKPPNEILKLVAVYYALYRAAIRNAQMKDTVLFEKANHCKKLLQDLKKVFPDFNHFVRE